ncbi:MAG: PIG-L family deacetylase [Acidobacteria bacterium]|nr:PIG-L family deacetylase [Acidobacteriota bacterium]
MKALSASIALLAVLSLPSVRTMAQAPQPAPLRVIAFGAHPDDAELKVAGTASLWAAQGAKVKLVAMTNGDIGHFEQAGGPLAKRRLTEVQQCARGFGTEVATMDIHDGELVPSLDNRRMMSRLIREWQADIVLGHRPYDYHPDHRYVGRLMDDSAVVVVAPFWVPDTPPTPRNPVFMYYQDDFKRPYPFQPDIVVSIDAVAEKKWACITAMSSQFGDADSWQARTRPNIPRNEADRQAALLEGVKQRNEAVANQYRQQLIALYGEQRGRAVKYAEAFELGQYGRQPSMEELRKMFPLP